MRLITWNIQCGKGCDGVTDLARIVTVAKEMADADVFCFQEVSDNFANLDGGADQSAQLAALLPDHRPVFRPGDRNDRQARPDASVRKHDSVASAGRCRSPIIFCRGRERARSAACAVTRWRSRSRRRLDRCGSSIRISNTTPPPARSADRRGCWTCSRKRRRARWRAVPARRALRESDAGGIKPVVRRFQLRRHPIRSMR